MGLAEGNTLSVHCSLCSWIDCQVVRMCQRSIPQIIVQSSV